MSEALLDPVGRRPSTRFRRITEAVVLGALLVAWLAVWPVGE
jgi:hypothetical protein